MKPSIDPRLKKVFSRIGVPPDEPFKADPFQLKALGAIRKSDCLVSAPTGSGKTWIAEEAIARTIKKGGNAWYASPLKALTNSKYIEFGERFGPQRVGILTGDRKENTGAPIVTGTTEILRNQLYDTMHEGTDLCADLVILDEAHFLGDRDRGVVWEEVMIYLPVRVPLLLLSATVGNARQIADWLESIRSKECVVVEETGRPVPLYPLFFHPSGRLLPLLGSKGVDKKVRAYLSSPSPPVLNSPRSLPPFGDIVKVMKRFQLLPAIFFLKSRADCDAALERCLNGEASDKGFRRNLSHRIEELAGEHPRLAGHRQMPYLKQAAVAAHHGGQLPAWKLVVERLMTEGWLDAVFATSTVAAGVNFPARSVVFLNSDQFNGHEFVPLNGTEFHQMTGRAGRRGKDLIGFAVAIPGKFMDLRLLAELYNAPPENVLSQIRIDFSMVLNLLLSHTPEEVKEIFRRSFATYLNMVGQQRGDDRSVTEAGRALMERLPEALCAGPDVVLELTRKKALVTGEIAELDRRLKGLQPRLAKIRHLVRGRLFVDRRNRMYCVIRPQTRRDEKGVLACRVKPGHPGRSRPLKMRWFRPEKISHILDTVLELPRADDTAGLVTLLTRVSQNEPPAVLDALPLSREDLSVLEPIKRRIGTLEETRDQQICNACPHFTVCHTGSDDVFGELLQDFARPWDALHAARTRLWNSFAKHLAFLKKEEFVTEDDRLTHDGMWTSQLRLDQPLMIAEGLRLGILPENDPALLAALVAPFVCDREMDVEVEASKIPKRLAKAYERMNRGLRRMAEQKAAEGFEARPVAMWPAVTLYAWANGQPWEKVLEVAGMAEGDLAMLVSRTADNLRQIASLTSVYPAIAHSATEAIAIILREPVLAD
jgi:superfamily II RNA helicase